MGRTSQVTDELMEVMGRGQGSTFLIDLLIEAPYH